MVHINDVLGEEVHSQCYIGRFLIKLHLKFFFMGKNYIFFLMLLKSCVCVCVCIHTYIHIYIYIYIYIEVRDLLISAFSLGNLIYIEYESFIRST